MKTCFFSVALASMVALLGESGVQAFEAAFLEQKAQESLILERDRSTHLAQVNPTQADIEWVATKLADYFWQREPIPDLSFGQSESDVVSLSLSEASELREQYVYQLMPELGAIAGYKAGLTSPAAQAQFGVEHPLRGVLLQDMLLESGATVPVDFGARPLFEADLIVRVSDDSINQAETPEEVLAALDVVIPFIELPDAMFGPDASLNAASLTAINVGARMGVLGSELPIEATEAGMAALGNLQVEIVDDSGDVLVEGNSSALLGHPLEVVLWLRDDLKQSGLCLRPGDLLSLGSITAPQPVLGPQTLRARYQGFGPNAAEDVVVTFE